MLKYRRIYFAISGILVAASLVALLLFGLKLGIDFTGGSLLEVSFTEPVPETNEIEVAIHASSVTLDSLRIQPSDNSFIIRSRALNEDEHQEVLSQLRTLGTITEKRFESIGPVIGAELKRKALYQIGIVALAIVIFVSWAFRKVSQLKENSHISWKFGAIALITLLHDVIITLGIFALLGEFFGATIDNSFIAAILLVLGYSVNDTIVVFDRIRENLIKNKYSDDTEKIINLSIKETITRSINTSITTLLVLLAVLLFGGSTIFYFVLALIIGILIGTYSSIFLASPLLYQWEKGK